MLLDHSCHYHVTYPRDPRYTSEKARADIPRVLTDMAERRQQVRVDRCDEEEASALPGDLTALLAKIIRPGYAAEQLAAAIEEWLATAMECTQEQVMGLLLQATRNGREPCKVTIMPRSAIMGEAYILSS